MEYLAHHGIKGQKWGVRRYQNSDGSLTDEGRRRYGYGKGADRVIPENTQARFVQGAKLGAKIGAGMGVVGGAASAATAIAVLSPYVAAGTVAAYAGASFIGSLGSGTLNGLIYGGAVGGIAGAVETSAGRHYIETYDKGLSNFERREGRSRNPSKKVHLV